MHLLNMIIVLHANLPICLDVHRTAYTKGPRTVKLLFFCRSGKVHERLCQPIIYKETQIVFHAYIITHKMIHNQSISKAKQQNTPNKNNTGIKSRRSVSNEQPNKQV